jgi:uncharacterized membrane protein YbjE (DUF340 family)
VLTYGLIKALSFTHSAIYLGLLIVWAIPGLAPAEFVLGMAHGLGWFVMCGLAIAGVRRRIIPFWLGVAVAIVGAVGPFFGSAGFIYNDRRESGRARGSADPAG